MTLPGSHSQYLPKMSSPAPFACGGAVSAVDMYPKNSCSTYFLSGVQGASSLTRKTPGGKPDGPGGPAGPGGALLGGEPGGMTGDGGGAGGRSITSTAMPQATMRRRSRNTFAVFFMFLLPSCDVFLRGGRRGGRQSGGMVATDVPSPGVPIVGPLLRVFLFDCVSSWRNFQDGVVVVSFVPAKT